MKAKSMLCLSVLAVAIVSICVLTVTAQPESWPDEFTGAECGTTDCSDCVGAFKDVEVSVCTSGYQCYVVEDTDTLDWKVCKHTGDSNNECNPWGNDEEGTTSCENANAFWCDCLPTSAEACDFSATGCGCGGDVDFTSTVTSGQACVE